MPVLLRAKLEVSEDLRDERLGPEREDGSPSYRIQSFKGQGMVMLAPGVVQRVYDMQVPAFWSKDDMEMYADVQALRVGDVIECQVEMDWRLNRRTGYFGWSYRLLAIDNITSDPLLTELVK